MSCPFSGARAPVNPATRTDAPTPNVFAAVAVNTPVADMVDDVEVAAGAVVDVVNVKSSEFHQYSKGGDKIVCITRFAAVRAGSNELPITGLWLKHSRFVKLIVSAIVMLETAMITLSIYE